MARIRINFGSDFCGHETCNYCFSNGAEATRKAATQRFRVDTSTQGEARLNRQAVTCPRCNANMVVRTNRNTGQQFMGCWNFPSCRGTREIVAKPKSLPVPEVPKRESVVTEPIKEITLTDLLGRPVKMLEEHIKTTGKLEIEHEEITEEELEKMK